MTDQEVEALVQAWRDFLAPRLDLTTSSLVESYVDNEPYRRIIAAGPDALSVLMEHLRRGTFLLNNAVMAVAGLVRADVVPGEEEPVSEQQLSELLLAWWERR